MKSQLLRAERCSCPERELELEDGSAKEVVISNLVLRYGGRVRDLIHLKI